MQIRGSRNLSSRFLPWVFTIYALSDVILVDKVCITSFTLFKDLIPISTYSCFCVEIDGFDLRGIREIASVTK